MITLRVLTSDDVTRGAYHQAGHAVAAHLLGRPVPDLSLEVEPEAAGTCGYALWAEDFGVLGERAEEAGAEGGGGEPNPTEIEAEVVACLAGPIAEAIYAGEFSEEAAEDDLFLVLELAEAAAADEAAREAFLDAAEARAESLLEAGWRAVEAVAGALLAERTLAAARVRELAAATA